MSTKTPTPHLILWFSQRLPHISKQLFFFFFLFHLLSSTFLLAAQSWPSLTITFNSVENRNIYSGKICMHNSHTSSSVQIKMTVCNQKLSIVPRVIFRELQNNLPLAWALTLASAIVKVLVTTSRSPPNTGLSFSFIGLLPSGHNTKLVSSTPFLPTQPKVTSWLWIQCCDLITAFKISLKASHTDSSYAAAVGFHSWVTHTV